jgi:hypothetical protein
MSIGDLDLRVHTQHPTKVRWSACSTSNGVSKRLDKLMNRFVAPEGILTRNWNVSWIRLYVDTQNDRDGIVAWQIGHRHQAVVAARTW